MAIQLKIGKRRERVASGVTVTTETWRAVGARRALAALALGVAASMGAGAALGAAYDATAPVHGVAIIHAATVRAPRGWLCEGAPTQAPGTGDHSLYVDPVTGSTAVDPSRAVIAARSLAWRESCESVAFTTDSEGWPSVGNDVCDASGTCRVVWRGRVLCTEVGARCVAS